MSWIAVAAWLATTSAATKAPTFKLESPVIKPGATINAEQIFNGMGCDGQNVSPELKWSGAPAGTKSFAVTLYDPDAPTGSGWWHWVVYDIPASSTGLEKGAGASDGSKLPAGSKQGRTDFGSPGFGGPCPPRGDKPHHYIFTVYALKTDHIEAPAEASAAMVSFMLRANKLASATITAMYGWK
jgi:hypothetical protein